jgi:hypothetical protein
MKRRCMAVLSFVLLAGGISGGVYGTLLAHNRIAHCGIFLTMVGLALVIVCTIRGTQLATADMLATADINGYRRALQHVAAGLLDQYAAPRPDPGTPASNLDTNVISLHPPRRTEEDDYERMAQ